MLPKITASVVVIRDGTVLLTQREDFETWCLPSGHVELGESLEEAARREALEETGYDVTLDRFVGMYSTLGDWPDMHSATFAGHIGADQPDSLLTPDEVLDIGWFDVEHLPAPMMWWQVRRIRDAAAGSSGMCARNASRVSWDGSSEPSCTPSETDRGYLVPRSSNGTSARVSDEGGRTRW